MCQNALMNTQSRGSERTYLRELQTGAMTRTAKQRCEAMYSVQECLRKVRNKCADEADAPCQDNGLGGQLDQQEGEGRVGVNLSGRNIVDALGTVATSKRMRYVKIEGQEASWAIRSSWNVSSTIGGA